MTIPEIETVAVESFPVAPDARVLLRHKGCIQFVARQDIVQDAGNDKGTLLCGMYLVGEKLGMVLQRSIKVDNGCPSLFSHLADTFLNLGTDNRVVDSPVNTVGRDRVADINLRLRW